MGRHLILCVLMCLFAAPPACEAQRRWYRSARRNYGYSGSGYGYGGYVSNPVEGARYGMAEVIRARGEAAESTTRAMINYEDARSSYLDNYVKWTESYWKRKRIGQAELQKDYDKKRARRDNYLANRKSGAPQRLSVNQLDPTTGKIYWPSALQEGIYARQRQELEELFILRAHTSNSARVGKKIHDTAKAMQSTLKTNIQAVVPTAYIAARKFLDSLGHEGQFPAA